MEQLAKAFPLALALLTMQGRCQELSAYAARGQHPKMESRIYGSSSNHRNRQLEFAPQDSPEPWRLLIVGDNLALGCGSKAYPPTYALSACTSLDTGFRAELLERLRVSSQATIVSVGCNTTTPSGSEHAHCAREGMTVDDFYDTVLDQIQTIRPDIILVMLGMVGIDLMNE